MLVKCKSNSGADLPKDLHHPERGITSSTEWDVTPGEVYPVYGITTVVGHQYYYVLEDDTNDSLLMVPAVLFGVVDPLLPPNWAHFYEMEKEDPINFHFLTACKEWIEDPMFLEKLSDGDPDTIAKFRSQTNQLKEFHAAHQFEQ